MRNTVYSDAQFALYADKVGEAFSKWQNRVNDSLCGINSETQIKNLINYLAGAILEEFQEITLIDKYDVYQVLLAYWQEVMADDVFIIIQDGYKAARETENIVEIISLGKNKGKEKILGWEGKLIPSAIIIETFFNDEQKAIDEIETLVLEKQAGLEEIIENADEGSIINDVLKEQGGVDILVLKEKLKSESLDEEEASLLKVLLEKKNHTEEHKKAAKNLKKALEGKVRERYGKLSDDEILELLVNKKWYKAIYKGIDALYKIISDNIANCVTELTVRYEETLPAITKRATEYEAKVRSHLQKMGFVW